MLRESGIDMVDLRGSCGVKLNKYGFDGQFVGDVRGAPLVVKAGAIVSKRLSPNNVSVISCAGG